MNKKKRAVDMKDRKSKSSKGLLIAAAAVGIADILLIAILVFSIVFREGRGAEVRADLPEDFKVNSDDYYNLEYEDEYSSDASVSYSGGKLDESASKSDAASGEDEKYSGFVFPDSDKVILTDERISKTVKDADTCRRAVNEIYARHGYEFTMQENIDFFNQYDWYKNMKKEPDMEKVSTQFSKTEKENVDKLLEFEDGHGWN